MNFFKLQMNVFNRSDLADGARTCPRAVRRRTRTVLAAATGLALAVPVGCGETGGPTPSDATAAASPESGRSDAIAALWDRGEAYEFPGVANVPIRSRSFVRPDQRGAVVISSGRAECMLKYRELIYDLHQAGYSVYIPDHRGQGFSGRMLEDSQIGHVAEFDDYVTDLKTYVDRVVRPSQEKLGAGRGPLFLLAHSMGGCIASIYLEKYPRDFRAGVLCSPMHQPSTGFIPEDLARMVADMKAIFAKGLEHKYALGKGPYHDIPYDEVKDPRDHALTHSKERYEQVRALYNANNTVKVGGPSYQWVSEAIKAGKRARENARLVEVPVLLLRAGDDSVVSPTGQDVFKANAGGRCTLVTVPGAFHELFVESDAYRARRSTTPWISSRTTRPRLVVANKQDETVEGQVRRFLSYLAKVLRTCFDVLSKLLTYMAPVPTRIAAPTYRYYDLMSVFLGSLLHRRPLRRRRTSRQPGTWGASRPAIPRGICDEHGRYSCFPATDSAGYRYHSRQHSSGHIP